MRTRVFALASSLALSLALAGCDDKGLAKPDPSAKPISSATATKTVAIPPAASTTKTDIGGSATATTTATPTLAADDAATPLGTDAAAAADAQATAAQDAGRTTAADAGGAAPAGARDPGLLDPSKATAQAPATFRAKFSTSKGDFIVKVTRDLAPNGADRFYNLVKIGFFNDVRFFRAIDNFMVQFGINGDPKVMNAWRNANIQDDPVKGSNKRGFITFAQTGRPNTRSTQVFINFKDNSNLDPMRFAPFGEVEGDGMKIVDSVFKGYGEGAPNGAGPDQGQLQMEGNAYLAKDFPKLDYVKTATIIP